MRSQIYFLRGCHIAAISAALFAAPVMANEGSVIFAPGTGQNVEASYAAPDTVNSPVKARNAQNEILAMGDKLADPDMQDGVAHMAAQMGAMMMKMPIGKFAAAIEKARPGTVRKPMREDATLADMAGPDADNIPAMLGDQSRMAMTMMSGFASVFAGMVPEFEKLGREMKTVMADVKTNRR